MPRHGGYRTPSNPAPVSGPGSLSQRTDGGPRQVQAEMSGMPYGETFWGLRKTSQGYKSIVVCELDFANQMVWWRK